MGDSSGVSGVTETLAEDGGLEGREAGGFGPGPGGAFWGASRTMRRPSSDISRTRNAVSGVVSFRWRTPIFRTISSPRRTRSSSITPSKG